jgi:hypothetical protein
LAIAKIARFANDDRQLFACEIFLASPGCDHRQILHHRDALERILLDRTKFHRPSAFAQRSFFLRESGVSQRKHT